MAEQQRSRFYGSRGGANRRKSRKEGSWNFLSLAVRLEEMILSLVEIGRDPSLMVAESACSFGFVCSLKKYHINFIFP